MELMATWIQQKTKTKNFKISQEKLYKQKYREEKRLKKMNRSSVSTGTV